MGAVAAGLASRASAQQTSSKVAKGVALLISDILADPYIGARSSAKDDSDYYYRDYVQILRGDLWKSLPYPFLYRMADANLAICPKHWPDIEKGWRLAGIISDPQSELRSKQDPFFGAIFSSYILGIRKVGVDIQNVPENLRFQGFITEGTAWTLVDELVKTDGNGIHTVPDHFEIVFRGQYPLHQSSNSTDLSVHASGKNRGLNSPWGLGSSWVRWRTVNMRVTADLDRDRLARCLSDCAG
jgi:hypothetical protein